MMIDASTKERVNELRKEAASLYQSLNTRAIKRLELIDEVWAQEQEGIKERTQFQRVITELEDIFDVIFAEEK